MSPAFRLSLGANVLLLGIVGALLWRDRPAPPAFHATRAAHPVSIPDTAPLLPIPAAKPAAGGDQRAQPAAPTLTPAAVTELEQSGMPREIVVSALLADLNRRWTARLVALQKRHAPAPVPERELRDLSRETTAEQERALREALGDEGYAAWDKEQALHALNRARPPGDELPMTAAEAEQAYRLQNSFDSEYRELQEMGEDGAADPADLGRLQAQAQQKLDRELEQILGKERFDALRGNAALAQTP